MKIIGIDSGKYGSIVELDITNVICHFLPMPWREDGMCPYTLIRRVIDFDNAAYIGFEKVQTGPQFGGANFKFGAHYQAGLQLLEPYPYDTFTPQRWQGRMHGTKTKGDQRTAKDRSAAVFRRMNPHFKMKMNNKEVGEGMRDAFLIAYYTGLKNNVVMPTNFEFIRLSIF
jgi:hypothetical protein